MKRYKILKKQVFQRSNYSLIPIRLGDRWSIMKWRNEQIYHLRQSKPLTRKDQDDYFKNVVSKLFDYDYPPQILFSFLKNEDCIGYGGLVHINWINKNAEISFIMDTNIENESFNEVWSNYLSLIEEVAFNEIKLHKIHTYAFDLRPHLYKVLEENGYYKEATLKEHCFIQEGFKNVIIHSKINRNGH